MRTCIFLFLAPLFFCCYTSHAQQAYALAPTTHSFWSPAVAISPDGAYMAANWGGGQIEYWELASGKRIKTLNAHITQIGTIAFSPDGKKLASILSMTHKGDLALKIHSFPEGNLLNEFQADSSNSILQNVCFNPDGSAVLVSGGMKIWGYQLSEKKEKFYLEDPLERFFSNAICTSCDSMRFRCISNIITDFDQRNSQVVRRTRSYRMPLLATPKPWSFSGDGHYFTFLKLDLSNPGKHSLELVDLQEGKVVKTISSRDKLIRCAALDEKGGLMLAGAFDGTTYLYDTKTWTILYSFKNPDAGYVASVKFIPHSDRVLIAYEKGYFCVWAPVQERILLQAAGAYKGYASIAAGKYYNADQEGLALLKSGEKPMSKFDANRRDILLEPAINESIAQAIGRNNGIPLITWATPPPHGIVANTLFNISAKVESGKPVTRYVLYNNNTVVTNVAKPQGNTVSFQVSLLPGENNMVLEVSNEAGVNRSESFAVRHQPSLQIQYHALLFAMSDEALTYSLQEADTLAKELSTRFGFKTEVIRNPDAEAFSAAIERYRQKKYSPNDHLLIYYTGHGSIQNGIGQLDLANNTSMPFSQLMEDVDIEDCQHLMLFIDACYSGGLGDVFYKGKPETRAAQNSTSSVLREMLEPVPARLLFTAGDQKVPARKNTFSDLTGAFLKALRNPDNLNDFMVRSIEIKDEIQRAKIIPLPNLAYFGNHNPNADFIFSIWNK